MEFVQRVNWYIICKKHTMKKGVQIKLNLSPRGRNSLGELGQLHSWDFRGSLQWRHNGPNSVSNHQPHDCLLNRLFRRRSKKTPKLHVTGLCAGNSPGNASLWWRHHVLLPWPRSSLFQMINSLSPIWHQSITWINEDYLLVGHLTTNFPVIKIDIFSC